MRWLSRKRFALTFLSLLAVIAGAFAWAIRATIHQGRLNAALVDAVDRGDMKATRTYLDRGADPDARIRSGHTSVWQYLTDFFPTAHGRRDRLPPTVLMTAVEHERKDIVILLLARGANVNARESGGLTALAYVFGMDYCTDTDGYSPPFDISLPKLLLDRGADPNVRTLNGPVLAVALEGKGGDLVPILLDKGADPNTRDRDRIPVLLIAAREGNSKIVKALLARGANTNVQDKDGRTVLMWALRMEDHDLVQAVLARNPNVNARDKQGRTALMLAAENDDYDAVKMLLDRGADPNVTNQFGVTTLQWAQGQGDSELVQLLEQAGAQE
jgi:ankyrin repeat protein